MRYQIVKYKDHDFRVRFQFLGIFWRYLKTMGATGDVGIYVGNSYDHAMAAARRFVAEKQAEIDRKTIKPHPEVLFDSNSELPPHRQRLAK